MDVFNPFFFTPKASPGSCQVFRTPAAVSLEGECTNQVPQTTAQFDGRNGYISTSYVQSYVTSYTIAAWIKTTSSQGVLVEDRGSGSGSSITLTIGASCGSAGGYCPGASAGVPAIGVDSNGVWIGLSGNKKVNDGSWHFIAATFEAPAGSTVTASDFSIYIDGKPAAGNTAAIGSAQSPLTGLGGTQFGYSPAWGYYYSGSLADVQIYNVTLSPSEVLSLYMEGIGGVPVDPAHVVGWWPLNANADSYSGYEYNGVATGGVSFTGLWYSGYVQP